MYLYLIYLYVSCLLSICLSNHYMSDFFQWEGLLQMHANIYACSVSYVHMHMLFTYTAILPGVGLITEISHCKLPGAHMRARVPLHINAPMNGTRQPLQSAATTSSKREMPHGHARVPRPPRRAPQPRAMEDSYGLSLLCVLDVLSDHNCAP